MTYTSKNTPLITSTATLNCIFLPKNPIFFKESTIRLVESSTRINLCSNLTWSIGYLSRVAWVKVTHNCSINVYFMVHLLQINDALLTNRKSMTSHYQTNSIIFESFSFLSGACTNGQLKILRQTKIPEWNNVIYFKMIFWKCHKDEWFSHSIGFVLMKTNIGTDVSIIAFC